MRILATMPGKFGDILWALPTLRALADTFGTPVDFRCCNSPHRFEPLLPLLRLQPYVRTAEMLEDWTPQEAGPFPFTPRVPQLTYDDNQEYDHVFHLGYEGWPAETIPYDIYRRAAAQMPNQALGPIWLDKRWITVPPEPPPGWFSGRPVPKVAVAFSDEHFELKYGVARLIEYSKHDWELQSAAGSPRWSTEGGEGELSWIDAAQLLVEADVALACCSALHVLACAVGTPVVMMEPAEGRWNGIFYPYGKTGPQVTLVMGNDDRPTFDARHVADTLQTVLIRVQEGRDDHRTPQDA